MNAFNPYSLFMDLRNKYYDTVKCSQINIQIPIISVGNLTAGGSGKTPFIMYLIQLMKTNNSKLNILVVSKSYKTKLKQPQEVILDSIDAVSMYGDEPCLIKKKYPEANVWSGPNKSETVLAALKYYKSTQVRIDLILIDDGFSHRKLKRSLDIVLLDATQSLAHYRVLPFGHMREDFSSLIRAQLIVLTKVNQARPETLNFLKQKIKDLNLSYIKTDLKTDFDQQISENTKAFVFSGIANPESFKKSLIDQKINIIENMKFPDHMIYTDLNQNDIYQRFLSSKAELICTTAKDLIKINHSELLKNIKVLEAQIKIATNEEVKIYETIRTLV